MAAGLMLIYLPLGIYVNTDDRSWPALTQRLFPDFAVQFVVSTAVTFGWISLAERMQRFLRRYLDEYILRPGVVWPNLLAGALFFVLSMAVIVLMLKGTEWLFYGAMEMQYPIADLAHSRRAIYGQFATLSLCVYVLIANRHIMDYMETTQIRVEQLEKEHLLSQFNALKNQVNPHFLFNSLSILSSLIHVSPELSEQFIDQLSKSYRYLLEQKDQSLVTLRTELEFIRSYAFLLKIRFENKFHFQIQLDESLFDQYRVAPLTLQLLLENAVKHNRMSVREPLVVTVTAEGATLVVKNHLQPRPTPDSSTGIGLQNIVNRYALLSDRPVEAGTVGDDFVVRIPLL